MATVSQFSTAQNFQRVNTAIDQLQTAIDEAQIAVRAGVPGAQDALNNATQALERVMTFKNVYFPSGAPQE